jgi:hypothetical protein
MKGEFVIITLHKYQRNKHTKPATYRESLSKIKKKEGP